MLERTAGCVENAGRRFLREPHGALRTRETLCTNLRHLANSRPELSQWHLVPRRLHSQDSNATADSVRSDTRPPTLGFLYPSQTQIFMANRLSRYSRSSLTRRKRWTGPSACRNFSSEADPPQPDGVQQPMDGHPAEDGRTKDVWARDELVRQMERGITHRRSDRAYRLYNFAGQPPDLKPALLQQYSKLKNERDRVRTKEFFWSIPTELRTAEDRLNMVQSVLWSGQLRDLTDICRDGLENHDTSCWTFCLSHFIKRCHWSNAQAIYELGTPVSDVHQNELWDSILPLLRGVSIENSLPNLAVTLQNQADDAFLAQDTTHNFAKFLLRKVLSSPRTIENMSTETLIRHLEVSESAALLTPETLFYVIRTLQSSKTRSKFIRSIVVYRTFHRLLEDQSPPPLDMLAQFIKKLKFFGITPSLQYFLNEISHFHCRPNEDVYQDALVLLSRHSEPSAVAKLFEQYVAHHGLPSDWVLLSPLLYVHARTGNVRATLSELDRLSQMTQLEPNEYCWNITLTAYANAGDLDGCFARFTLMIEQGLKLQAYPFGIVMGICAKRGDTERVFQLLDLAKKHKVALTMPMLDTVVESHCSNQKMRVAEGFAEACLAVDAGPSSRVRMWNVLLWNYAFRFDLEAISRIRTRMDAAGIQPDDMTFAALLLSLGLLRQTDSARRILRKLHRDGRIHVTEFHYTLVLYGYVIERNRDMVHIIWREIEERFKDPGLSARLLLFKNQLQRDVRRIEDAQEENDGEPQNVFFANAERILAETIKSFNPLKLATKQPKPGIKKPQPVGAFPAEFYQNIISEYGKQGRMDRVEQLFNDYAEGRGLSAGEARNDAPLGLLSALMAAYLKKEEFDKVTECWQASLLQAQKIALPTADDLDLGLVDRLQSPRGDSPSSDVPESYPPLPSQVQESGHSVSMISDARDSTLALQTSAVLPKHRFLLSRHISLQIRSLAYDSKTSEVDQVIAEVESHGFSLSTFNWSTYIQLFAASDNAADTLRAFSVFERKFMPAFPRWKQLVRSRGKSHSDAPRALDLIEGRRIIKPKAIFGPKARRYWSKMHPEFMQPTYVSFVYLASALLRVRSKSVAEGSNELYTLHDAAPNTIKAIAEMPVLKDKFQGVLLRHLQEAPTPSAAGRNDGFVWTGGLLGVGGRRRLPEKTKPPGKPLPQTQHLPQTEPASSTMSPPTPDIKSTEPPSTEDSSLPTLSHEDEWDVQAELSLSARRRRIGSDQERMDDKKKTDIQILHDERAWHNALTPDFQFFEKGMDQKRKAKRLRKSLEIRTMTFRTHRRLKRFMWHRRFKRMLTRRIKSWRSSRRRTGRHKRVQ